MSSVHRSQMTGNALAREVQRVLMEEQITVDVVIPVPDTSRVAALNLAQALGLPYREGFVKNRYVSLTRRIRPCLIERPSHADSIVRGTTSREIIQMAKDVGSKKVIMASCAPPIRYSNVYGIDMTSRAELIAHRRTTEEVAEAIGADLPDTAGPGCERGVDAAYLDHLEGIRSDNMKTKAAVVNGLASAQAAAVAAVVAVGEAGAAVGAPGVSSASGGSDSTGTPSSHRHTGGVDDTIVLHNTWKLS
ncbi:phosphoribosyltransferase-like protein [Lactarius hengduanensis]|nr:phosphoribosyltransferase-like protein [Lactarius hengduanensis]